MKYLKEDDFLIKRINDRIDYLNYVSSKIKVYGHKSATKECKELFLYSKLSFDKDDILNVENIDSKKIDIIFKECINDSFFKDNKMTREKITYNGNLNSRLMATKCRVIFSCLANNLTSLNPTNISKIINRSRQVVHTHLKELQSWKKSKSKEHIELYSVYLRIEAKIKTN